MTQFATFAVRKIMATNRKLKLPVESAQIHAKMVEFP